ncbi:MAG: hypothetical protein D084_Lepto4C00343G0001, partial [Leptospirillum sp. Group IV 'UBA BS']
MDSAGMEEAGPVKATRVRERETTLQGVALSDPLEEEEGLGQTISRAISWLVSAQHETGYWVAPLEADVTIPSEYLFLHEFIGRPIEPEKRKKIVDSILSLQGKDGGWPLFRDGDPDISATVKAYLALKLSGFSSGH